MASLEQVKISPETTFFFIEASADQVTGVPAFYATSLDGQDWNNVILRAVEASADQVTSLAFERVSCRRHFV